MDEEGEDQVVSQIHLCHLMDAEPVKGSAISPPIELWPVAMSEMNPPRSAEDPSRPPRYRACFLVDEERMRRHEDPAAHEGAVGTYPDPLDPIKIDRWDLEIGTWVTHWHHIEGQMPI